MEARELSVMKGHCANKSCNRSQLGFISVGIWYQKNPLKIKLEWLKLLEAEWRE